MAEENVQVERIKIVAEDLASAPSAAAARGFAHAGQAASGLGQRLASLRSNALMLAASATGLGLGFGAIARQAVGANRELDKTTKSLAAVQFGMQQWDKKLSTVERMNHAMREGKEVVERLEAAEEKLAVPMEELAATYRSLATAGFGRLRMSQTQMNELFDKTAAAAKAVGVNGQTAAMTITRAMMSGTIRGVDPFSAKLKEAAGSLKGLSAPQIYARISRGLDSLAPAAEIMATGFDAALFRLQDFIGDTLRDVGMPVFNHIAQTIEKWKKHLEAAKANGRDLVKEFGEKLLSGFKAIERLSSLIVDHWKILAGIWAANKGLNLLSSGASGLAGMAAAKTAAAPTGMAGVAAKLSGFASSLTVATTAAYALGKAFEFWIDKKGVEFVEAKDRGQKLNTFLQAAAEKIKAGKDREGLAQLRQIPGLVKGNQLDVAAFRSIFKDAEHKDKRAFVDTIAGKGSFAQGLSHNAAVVEIAETFRRLVATAQRPIDIYGPSPDLKSPHPVTKAPVTNFTGDIFITQDFKDADPDRVFVKFKSDMEGLAENPKQSSQGSPFSY